MESDECSIDDHDVFHVSEDRWDVANRAFTVSSLLPGTYDFAIWDDATRTCGFVGAMKLRPGDSVRATVKLVPGLVLRIADLVGESTATISKLVLSSSTAGEVLCGFTFPGNQFRRLRSGEIPRDATLWRMPFDQLTAKFGLPDGTIVRREVGK